MSGGSGHQDSSAESGFTLVEVLVAAVILVVAALGAAEVLIGSGRANFRAEQTQVATEQLQAELEQIRSTDYAEIALTGDPPSTGPRGPGDRLRASCASQRFSTDGCFALSENGANAAPLVVNGGALEDDLGELDDNPIEGGTIDPGPEQFTTGDISGTIHRYVVWRDDAPCGEENCPGGQDYKRVVVVITLDNTASGGDRAYRETQSDFIDPDTGRNTEPTPEPIKTVVAEQFYLSDTGCDQTTRPAASERSSHALHNTLGDCGDGERIGATPGAPDLLIPEPPANALPSDTPTPPGPAGPFHDYATDVEPTDEPENDRGLQLFPPEMPAGAGCVSGVDQYATHQDGHAWLTNPVPAGASFVADGGATLTLSSQILNQVPGKAQLCILVFVRESVGGGGFVDTPITDASTGLPYFTYTDTQWPTEKTSIPIDLELAPDAGGSNVTLGPGQRLGLAVSLNRAQSDVSGIQIEYEHPESPSVLEVETSSIDVLE